MPQNKFDLGSLVYYTGSDAWYPRTEAGDVHWGALSRRGLALGDEESGPFAGVVIDVRDGACRVSAGGQLVTFWIDNDRLKRIGGED